MICLCHGGNPLIGYTCLITVVGSDLPTPVTLLCRITTLYNEWFSFTPDQINSYTGRRNQHPRTCPAPIFGGRLGWQAALNGVLRLPVPAWVKLPCNCFLSTCGWSDSNKSPGQRQVTASSRPFVVVRSGVWAPRTLRSISPKTIDCWNINKWICWEASMFSRLGF